MNQPLINPQAVSDAMIFAPLPAHVTGPVLTERPPIRVPRSVNRSFSDSELQSAATMLNKLRCREDQKLLAHGPVFDDAGHAIDVTVDRLLKVLAAR